MSFVHPILRFATRLKPWTAAALVLALGTLGAAPSAWAQSTDLSACMAELRPAAHNGKVSDATWSRHTAGLQADFSVIDKLNFQPEFRTAIWDYMSALVDEERVADGKARLTEHRQALERAEQHFGVDAATVVAVYVPRRWILVPFLLASFTALARVYYGAHLPLDVVGGAGLGIACGALALLVTGEHRTSSELPTSTSL